jgi:cupin fold WbuC family metalloprotein
MKTRPFNREVLYPDEPIVTVTRADAAQFGAAAAKSERHRMRLCAHDGPDHTLHEMIVALTREAYVRPHKHLNKAESFHVIEGRADIYLFDDDGRVQRRIELGDYASGLCFFYRLSQPIYHTLRVLTPVFLFHETTNGPFKQGDAQFAPWGPPESDPAACAAFMERLTRTADGEK